MLKTGIGAFYTTQAFITITIICCNGILLCEGCMRESFYAFQEGFAPPPHIKDIFKAKANLPDEEPRTCGEMFDSCRFESDCCPENHCMMTTGENIAAGSGVVNMCFPKKLRTEPLEKQVITVKDEIIMSTSPQTVAPKLAKDVTTPLNNEQSFDYIIPNIIFTPDSKANWTPIDLHNIGKLIYDNLHLFNRSEIDGGVYKIDQNRSRNSLRNNETKSTTDDHAKGSSSKNNTSTLINKKKFRKILNREFSKAMSALHKIHDLLDGTSILKPNKRFSRRKRSNDSVQGKYKNILKFIKKSKNILKKNVKIIKNPFPTCIKIIRKAVIEFGKYEKELPKTFYEIEYELQEVVLNMTEHIRYEISKIIEEINEDENAMQRAPPRPSALTEKDMTSQLELLKLKLNVMYDTIEKAVEKYVTKEDNSSDEVPKTSDYIYVPPELKFRG